MYIGKCKIRKRTSLKNVLYDILWNLRIDHYLWSGPIKHSRKEGVSSLMFGKVPRWNPLLWRIYAMPAAAGNDPPCERGCPLFDIRWNSPMETNPWRVGDPCRWQWSGGCADTVSRLHAIHKFIWNICCGC